MGCPPMSESVHFHRGYSLRLHKSKPFINYGIISSGEGRNSLAGNTWRRSCDAQRACIGVSDEWNERRKNVYGAQAARAGVLEPGPVGPRNLLGAVRLTGRVGSPGSQDLGRVRIGRKEAFDAQFLHGHILRRAERRDRREQAQGRLALAEM